MVWTSAGGVKNSWVCWALSRETWGDAVRAGSKLVFIGSQIDPRKGVSLKGFLRDYHYTGLYYRHSATSVDVSVSYTFPSITFFNATTSIRWFSASLRGGRPWY